MEQKMKLQAYIQKYQPYYKDTFLLALPLIISQLGHTLVALVDSLIIGQTGKVPLAAVSLGNSIFTIFMVTGIGISYGLTPLIAQQNGQGNKPICGRLLVNSLLINMTVGVLLFGVILFTSTQLENLGQDREVAQMGKTFLQYLGMSFIPLMLYLTFKQFAEGLGFTRQAMQITIFGNILNVLVGMTLVFGWFGFPKMGVAGVGIATFLDRFLMGIVMAVYVFKSAHFKSYLRQFHFKFIHKPTLKKIWGLGVPVAMQYIFEVSAFSGAAIMVGWIGATELAAHQIALSLAAMAYMMASGIASAAAIKTGNHLGSRSFLHLRRAAVSSYHIAILFMSVTALLFILLNDILPKAYISDPEVIAAAASLLLIAAFFQLFDGTQVVGLGVLRGLGDVKVPTFITFLAYWVVGIPVGYVMGITLEFGVQGVWWGLSAGLLFASVALFFRFQQQTKHLEQLQQKA
jgi:MATE family multidrug resistance protein